MPEIISKYPDVVINVLKSSGTKCGAGQKQKILTQCPPAQFCSFNEGEICVYGLNQISAMTQINSAEMNEVIKGVPSMYSPSNLIVLILLFAVGLLLGMRLGRKK
jgi:hypothetical protein